MTLCYRWVKVEGRVLAINDFVAIGCISIQSVVKLYNLIKSSESVGIRYVVC